MAFTLREEIAAPPAQVFEHLHDPELVKSWMPGLISMETLSPNPREPGARFQYLVRQFGKRMTMQGELLEFLEPSRLVVRLTAMQFSFDISYEIRQGKQGSTLVYRFTLNEKSKLPKILISPFEKFMQKMASQQIASLRNEIL